MKRNVIIALLCLVGMVCRAADLRLVSGGIDCLKGEKFVAAEIDCSKATWRERFTFDAYLETARRVEGWEVKSMEYFNEWFNDEVANLTAVTDKEKVNYTFVVMVRNVNRYGNITSDILLVDNRSGETVATFYFQSSDGDEKDHITFRDPMKQAGECMGKAIRKYFRNGKIDRIK
ncbi:MAG: hypothetical protein Q4D28_00585 [Prevotellaceae bacterium]|nr:hypothetical protein [Prevotellaceae bacterium]